jgi:hypothetical protein
VRGVSEFQRGARGKTWPGLPPELGRESVWAPGWLSYPGSDLESALRAGLTLERLGSAAGRGVAGRLKALLKGESAATLTLPTFCGGLSS